MLKFDNQIIDISGIGKEDFSKALSFFFGDEKETVKQFAIDKKYGLVLYWAEIDTATKLPYVMNLQAIVEFAWNWLQTVDYGKGPDHDGDNAKGWRIFNESWGRIAGRWEALVAIRPLWAMYGK